jgi:hypothetical protein
MFGYFADGLQAYNQVGLFMCALVCLGIGGLILANSLYWHLHARRVAGTVVGVIARNGMYTPVYRYTSPDGQTHEAKSDVSSSAMRGKETGRIVRLMISPHDPSQAQETSSWLLDAIGALLFAVGTFLGYTAITAYPVTWMTWLMAAAMLAYLVEHGRRILIPKAQRPSYAQWRQRRAAEAAINSAEITPIEQLLTAPETQATLRVQARANRLAAPLVAVFAAVLLVVGVYQARDVARLEASGLRAQGAVVRLKGGSSGSARQYTYHAIVRFRTDRNEAIEFRDSFGRNPPSYRAGDRVTVLYNADDPRSNVMIDRGPFWNWAIPGLLLLGAALLGWLFVAMIAKRPAEQGAAARPVAANG